jgi:Domain of unknown function (DUF4157)/Xanthomonas XOO_2897-like deaminase
MGNQRLIQTQTAANDRKPHLDKRTKQPEHPMQEVLGSRAASRYFRTLLQQPQAEGATIPNPLHSILQSISPVSPRMIQTKPKFRGLSHELTSALDSRGMVIQAKMTIQPPGDQYEQEADRVAEQVVQKMHAPSAQESMLGEPSQRQKREEDGHALRMKPLAQRQPVGGMAATPYLESSIKRFRGGGQPLDAGLQRMLGQAMGADFSKVRMHTDSQADQLNRSIQAKAFTTGQDVFFQQGAYQPGSRGGQELIAHELTHVVQQNGDLVQRAPQEEGSTQKMESGDLNEDLSDEDIHLSPEELEQLFAAGKDIDELPLSEQEQLDEADINDEEQIDEEESVVQPALVIQRAKVSYFNHPSARFARRKRQAQNVGGRNIATAKVRVNGVRSYITKKSKGLHSEKRLFDAISVLRNLHGNANVNVRWIYTELQPCGADNHNCKNRLRNWFPNVPIHYSIKYPSSKFGISRATAQRRRKRAVGTLRRFGTRLRQGGPVPANANSFRPPLRRVNSDPNLASGVTL